MTRLRVLPDLQVDPYVRSSLHSEDCAWVEKNCYVDLFIELIHALKLEPKAMLPFTLAMDFEGDQWTFFKPQHSELRQLFGIDVQEMNCWRPLIEHAQEHMAAGRLIAVEANAHWMPDTAGTDYRQNHVKTTIMLADLDMDKQRLGYFHNAGYYQLEGEDFRQTFRLDAEPDPSYLPLFAELVRVDRLVRRPEKELAEMSRALVKTYLGYRPESNPITRFAERFGRELPILHAKGLPHYHAWAFSTIRQLGAAFELAATHLQWLGEVEGTQQAAALAPAVTSFQQISQGNKALILKIARAVNGKRQMDPNEVFGEMAQAWDTGMTCLDAVI
ncbi:MAG: DUF1839 family protein [Aquabacterium sp.]|nr:DUF1839 family protein [Aquabacterium sp.]